MSILDEKFLSKYKNKQPLWGFNGLGFIVYKRTYSRIKENGQKEDWWETVTRCVEGAQKLGADYTKEEAEQLFDYVFNLKCNFAGRMLWQLGTDSIERFGANSLLNCWAVQINAYEKFCFLFENLMLGGGVGFSIRREDIHELPRIKEGVEVKATKDKDSTFIVPDCREGWVNLLRKVLRAYFDTGKSFSYSTILLRGYGEPIKGFGGIASGPQLLVEHIEQICGILKSREGKKLRSIDVLDICNIIGALVVSGNVRRSSQIALGDPDDYLFVRAKRWDLGNIPNWRAMSNNTIYADNYEHISNDIWEGYKGNGEPYGLFNIRLVQSMGRLEEKIRDSAQLTNPCFSGDTRIATKEGLIKIKDLEGKNFDTQVDIRVDKGDAIYSEAKGVFLNPCTQVKLTQKETNVFKLITEHGHELKVTDYHEFPVVDYKNIKNKKTLISKGRKQLKELMVGDKLLLQSGIGTFGSVGNYNQGLLLGLLVGDGTFSRNSSHFLLAEKDFGEAENIKNILYKELREIETYFCDSKENWRITSLGKNNKEKLKKLVSSRFFKFLKEKLKIEDPYDVKNQVPECIWRGTKEMVLGYLHGLIFTDGTVVLQKHKNKNGDTFAIQITQCSLELLKNVQVLLQNLGISSRINKTSNQGMRLLPDGRGGLKEYFCRENYRLDINRFNSVKLLELMPLFGRKNKIFEEKIFIRGKSFNKLERYINKVKSIEYEGKEDVYCFTEPHTNSTIANGVIAAQCGEISLSDMECCNLSELYLNNISSKEEMLECAKLLYKTQKAICMVPFIHEETTKIVRKNMRLGLGVTGICQSLNKLEWLDYVYKELRKFDIEWSKKKGWNKSIKLTTVKPSGTLSLLAGATPGIHPGYSKYYIRRVRMASDDELVVICKGLGYSIEYASKFDNSIDYNTVIVEFPCFVGEEVIITKDMSAIRQLELLKQLQKMWSDNSVSVTVYYRKEELEDIKNWLKENYKDSIKSVSFLLHSDHGFKQAPYEEITEEEYLKLIKKIKPIKFENIGGEGLDLEECSSGACPIK